MAALGQICIVGAFGLALYAIVSSLVGVRLRARPLIASGEHAAYAVTALLTAAALTLLTASFLIHLFGEKALELVAAHEGWAYQFKGITKHGAEVAGWLLLALGFVVGLQDRASSDHEVQVARARR
jgi:hypothetical protein